MKNVWLILVFALIVYEGNAQNYQWAFGMGETYMETGNGIGTDASGNVYVTGQFWNTFDADPGPGTVLLSANGGYFFYLAKYDALGNYVWAFALPAGWGYSLDLVMDDSANIIITGRYNNSGPVDFDPGPGVANLGTQGDPSFIAKYDSAGNYVWAKRLMGIQGSGCDAYNVALDYSANILVTGTFYDSIDFDPGPPKAMLGSTNGGRDIFLGKYTPAGDYIWAFSLPGSSPDLEADVSADDSGNIYLTGTFGYSTGTIDMDPGPGVATLTSTGIYSIFVAKYDSAGNYQWAFALDAGAGGNCQGSNIAVDDSANIYLSGFFRYALDLDPGTGITNITYSGPSWGGFFAKYNSAGAFQWGFGDASNYFYPSDIIPRNDGTVYIGGAFTGTIDIDPGPSVFLLDQVNGASFFAWYNTSGTFSGAFNFGGLNCGVSKMSFDLSNNLFLTGSYSAPGDFDPGPNINILPYHGQTDVFVTKYALSPNAVFETNADPGIDIFPNPVTNHLIISNNNNELSEIIIYDISSRKLLQQTFFNSALLNIEQLARGIYLYEVRNKNEVIKKGKVVKD